MGKILWRKKWPLTPVFLPGKFHGQGSLLGYSPWGCKESDTTEWLNHHILYTHTCNACTHMYSFTVAEVYPRPGALKAHGEIVWFERCSLGKHTYERKEEAIFFRGQGKTGIGRPPSTQRSTQEWVLLGRVVWHQLEKIDVLGLLYPWVAHSQGRSHSL